MKRRLLILGLLISVITGGLLLAGSHVQAQTQESGSVGIEGTISSAPPTQGATISVPSNGQTFTSLPVTVSGLCPNDLVVKVFKNNVFAGATQCKNGSYSVIIDLFNGQNELVARVFDALDQAGPDSNIVTVTYVDPRGSSGTRVLLTSNFAKRGANPGQTLVWPLILSGGVGPYAISVDWGDGKPADLLTQQFPGTFNVNHVYDNPGVYNIVIRATDSVGSSAFLQLVGVANGPLTSQSTQQEGPGAAAPKTRILWEPIALLLPFVISTFWLGKRYELKVLRDRIARGENPFA